MKQSCKTIIQITIQLDKIWEKKVKKCNYKLKKCNVTIDVKQKQNRKKVIQVV